MKSRLFNIRLSFEITENKSEGFFLLKNDLISLLDAIQRTGSIKLRNSVIPSDISGMN